MIETRYGVCVLREKRGEAPGPWNRTRRQEDEPVKSATPQILPSASCLDLFRDPLVLGMMGRMRLA